MSSTVTLENFRCCTQLPGPRPENRLALEKSRLWPNGSKLVVNMWGQSDFVRSKVIEYATQWNRYANLTFEWMARDAPGDSDIRVSFNKGGSWSVLGKWAQNVPQTEATMNFGWFNDQTSDEEFSRTVIHEFGHAIGCVHEQSSPAANIQWNKQAVYEYYWKNDGWDQAKVDWNVFQKYEPEATVNTKWDSTSIMQYPIPMEFTTNGVSADWNRKLSPLDKIFIMRCYPREGIVRNTQDGVYFVNCTRGDQRASGIAYYTHFGNNDGQTPDDYVIVNSDDFQWWENGGEAGFRTGAHTRMTVSWNLADDAGRSPKFSRVGFAEKSKDTKWDVYRDDSRVLYERDGWRAQAMFWAF